MKALKGIVSIVFFIILSVSFVSCGNHAVENDSGSMKKVVARSYPNCPDPDVYTTITSFNDYNLWSANPVTSARFSGNVNMAYGSIIPSTGCRVEIETGAVISNCVNVQITAESFENNGTLNAMANVMITTADSSALNVGSSLHAAGAIMITSDNTMTHSGSLTAAGSVHLTTQTLDFGSTGYLYAAGDIAIDLMGTSVSTFDGTIENSNSLDINGINLDMLSDGEVKGNGTTEIVVTGTLNDATDIKNNGAVCISAGSYKLNSNYEFNGNASCVIGGSILSGSLPLTGCTRGFASCGGGTPECTAGDEETQSCGDNGTQTRSCENGLWGQWGECSVSTDPCENYQCGSNSHCEVVNETATCVCNTDYIEENGTCINSKQVNCTDSAPANATSDIQPVTITYTTVNGWSTPSECAWECNTDYISEDGSTCINSKQVDCTDSAPVNATSTIAQYTIAYTTAGGWTTAPECHWECNSDYISEDGSTCINSKQVDCTDNAPANATSDIQPVTVTYTTAGGWTTPSECIWSCNVDYISEDGSTCINSKQVDCTDNAPANAASAIESVIITYTTAEGWTEVPECVWSCNPDYISEDESSCINSKQVPCIDNSPENATAQGSTVTINYSDASGWEEASECAWQCNSGYHTEDNVSCVSDIKSVLCIENAPENGIPLPVEVEVHWTGTEWTEPVECEWNCIDGYHREENICERNTKIVNCNVNSPANAHEVSYTIQINWIDGAWESVPDCPWECDTNYFNTGTDCINTREDICLENPEKPVNTQDHFTTVTSHYTTLNGWTTPYCNWECILDHTLLGGECVHTWDTTCVPGPGTPPENVVLHEVPVTIEYFTATGWQYEYCEWDCLYGYVYEAGHCINRKIVPCSVDAYPENGYRTSDYSTVYYTEGIGWSDGSICPWGCVDGFHKSGNSCDINSRIVQCADYVPEHTVPDVETAEQIWEGGYWLAPDCPWHCEYGWTLNDYGTSCINSKLVKCSDNTSRPEGTVNNWSGVTITWDGEQWSTPEPCEWECPGNSDWDGTQCITTKTVECRDVAPQNATSVIASHEIRYDQKKGWPVAPECQWNCDTGYTSDDGLTCINQKLADCIDNSPENATISSNRVLIHYAEGAGWETAAECNWNCNYNYFRTDQNVCVHDKEVTCTDNPQRPEYNSQNIEVMHTVEYFSSTGWQNAPICEWECLPGFIYEKGSCINGKYADCNETEAPENMVVKNVQTLITYSEEDGWSEPSDCPFECAEGFGRTATGKCARSQEVDCFDAAPQNAVSETRKVIIEFDPQTGWHRPENCDWQCGLDYISEDGETCINTKTVDCVEETPQNAQSTLQQVTILYTTKDGWSDPSICDWTCLPDNILVEGSCINSMTVECTDAAPANAVSTIETVSITYTDADGWTSPSICSWTCASGFINEDDQCINNKMVDCIDSPPANAQTAAVVQVPITYTENEGWSAPEACPFECLANYVTEDEETCINSKDVPCNDNPPQNAVSVAGLVTISYTDDTGWSKVPNCIWNCITGFHQVDQSCEADTMVVSCIDNPPANATSVIENVEITWGDGAWPTPADCEWNCNKDYFWNGSACEYYTPIPCGTKTCKVDNACEVTDNYRESRIFSSSSILNIENYVLSHSGRNMISLNTEGVLDIDNEPYHDEKNYYVVAFDPENEYSGMFKQEYYAWSGTDEYGQYGGYLDTLLISPDEFVYKVTKNWNGNSPLINMDIQMDYFGGGYFNSKWENDVSSINKMMFSNNDSLFAFVEGNDGNRYAVKFYNDLYNNYKEWRVPLNFFEELSVQDVKHNYLDNSYYLVGSVSDIPAGTTAGYSDCFVAKLDAYGTVLNQTTIGSSLYEDCRSLAVSSDGSTIFITGQTNGEVVAGEALGSNDIFVASLDTNLNVNWTKQFGTGGNDLYPALDAFNSSVHVIYETGGSLPGHTNESSQFGDVTSDLVVQVFDFTGLETNSVTIGDADRSYHRPKIDTRTSSYKIVAEIREYQQAGEYNSGVVSIHRLFEEGPRCVSSKKVQCTAPTGLPLNASTIIEEEIINYTTAYGWETPSVCDWKCDDGYYLSEGICVEDALGLCNGISCGSNGFCTVDNYTEITSNDDRFSSANNILMLGNMAFLAMEQTSDSDPLNFYGLYMVDLEATTYDPESMQVAQFQGTSFALSEKVVDGNAIFTYRNENDSPNTVIIKASLGGGDPAPLYAGDLNGDICAVTSLNDGGAVLVQEHGSNELTVSYYDPAGVQSWIRTVSTATGDITSCSAVEALSNGDVVVTGKSENSGNYIKGFAISLYSADGADKWVRTFGSSGATRVTDTVISSTDQIHISGTTDNCIGTCFGLGDGFISELDPLTGQDLWISQFGTANDDSAGSLFYNESGNYFVLSGSTFGEFENTSGPARTSAAGYLMKMNKTDGSFESIYIADETRGRNITHVSEGTKVFAGGYISYLNSGEIVKKDLSVVIASFDAVERPRCSCDEGYFNTDFYSCSDRVRGVCNTPDAPENATIYHDDADLYLTESGWTTDVICGWGCESPYVQNDEQCIHNLCKYVECDGLGSCYVENDTALCDCEEGYTNDGAAQCINSKDVTCIDTPPENGFTVDNTAIVTIYFGGTEWGTPDLCPFECNTGYVEQENTCINEKQVECIDSPPANAQTVATNFVTVYYNSDSGVWSTPDRCTWECLEGYISEDGETCINSKQVACTDNSPENSESISELVTVSYNSSTGWSVPEDCAWTCSNDYYAENGQCINEKIVDCKDYAPVNAVSQIEQIVITYTDAGGWTSAPECSWSCVSGFHVASGTENCFPNQKTVDCYNNAPANSDITREQFTINWSDTSGWEQIPECAWNCSYGFVLSDSGNACINEKTEMCFASENIPDNSHNILEETSIVWNPETAVWQPSPCEWDCNTDYFNNGSSCINSQIVECRSNPEKIENSHDLVVDVEIGYTTAGGWAEAPYCDVECAPGYLLSDGDCINSSKVLCSVPSQIPQNMHAVEELVTVYIENGQWTTPSECQLACNEGFDLYLGNCVNVRTVTCDQEVPEHAVLSAIYDVDIVYNTQSGWSSPEKCPFTCLEGFTLKNDRCLNETINQITYTFDEDFASGDPVGVEYHTVADQLQIDFNAVSLHQYIWVPNSEGDTVSKINVVTGYEEGRYRVCPEDESGSPSRTTVDSDGNMWVGNRSNAKAVKILRTPVDRNGDGIITTSTGKDDVLPFGEEEAIALYIDVPGGPRGIAVDRHDNVYIGGFGGDIYYLNGQTGEKLKEIRVPYFIYGGFVGKEGDLWLTAVYHSGMVRIKNPAAGTDFSDLPAEEMEISLVPVIGREYGVGAGPDGDVYVAGGRRRRYDIEFDRWVYQVKAESGEPGWFYGVAPGPDGRTWAATGYGVFSFDSVTGEFQDDVNDYFDVNIGIAVDAFGKVWTMSKESDTVHRIDPDTYEVDLNLYGHPGPYSYSDMTGMISRNVTVKKGTWSVKWDSEIENATWGMVKWNGTEPVDSAIEAKVRTSHDLRVWSDWQEIESGIPFDSLPSGRYIDLEMTLVAETDDVTPILYDVTINTASEDNESNLPPVFTTTPPETATAGDLYSYQATAEDPENGILIYHLSEGPEGLTLDSATGLVEWTPAPDQWGSHPVSISAVDENGAYTVHSWKIFTGCPDGMTAEKGVCISQKQVICDSETIPEVSTEITREYVPINYTTALGWESIPECPWTCKDGFTLEDGHCVTALGFEDANFEACVLRHVNEIKPVLDDLGIDYSEYEFDDFFQHIDSLSCYMSDSYPNNVAIYSVYGINRLTELTSVNLDNQPVGVVDLSNLHNLSSITISGQGQMMFLREIILSEQVNMLDFINFGVIYEKSWETRQNNITIKSGTEEYMFFDHLLAQCILKKVRGNVSEIKNIENLDCTGIRQISGLQQLESLRHLKLTANLSGYSPTSNVLTEIKTLETLYLSGRLNSMLRLTDMPNLNHITAYGEISYAKFVNIPNLTYVNLSGESRVSQLYIENLGQISTFRIGNKYPGSIRVSGYGLSYSLPDRALAGCVVESAVGDVRNLETITDLRCTDRNVKSAEGLGLFPELRDIDLQNNDIYTPVYIPDMPELKTLNFRNNRATALTIDNSPVLETVYAESNQLLSVNIAHQSYIETLLLSNNNIESLDITDALNLDILAVDSNALETLNIRRANQLYSVDVSGNPLTNINIVGSKNIRSFAANQVSSAGTVTLSGVQDSFVLGDGGLLSCIVEDVKGNIEKVSAISNLRCRNKTMYDVEGVESLPALSSFEVLESSVQDISGVAPTGILTDVTFNNNESLENVVITDDFSTEVLDLRDNEISSITLVNMPNLHTLYLSGNNLTSLILDGLSSLRTLVYTDGTLESVSLANMDSLEYVDLSNNNITDITLINLPNLKNLNINGNPIQNIHVENAQAIEEVGFDDSAQNITFEDESYQATFKDPALLGCIMLATENDASRIPELVTLDCTGGYLHKKIVNISGVEQLESLNELYLSENEITDITPAFAADVLVNLSSFAADKNALSGTVTFENHPALSVLSLEGNNISGVHIDNLPLLDNVSFAGNPVNNVDIYNCDRITRFELSNHSAVTSVLLSDIDGTTRTYRDGKLVQCLVESVSGDLPQLETIAALNCQAGEIANIDGLEQHTQLSDINLKGNVIRNLSPVNLPASAEYLDVSQNLLNSLAVSGMPVLTTINASNNRLVQLSIDNLDALTEINAVSNSLSSVDINGTPNLQSLKLTGNPISQMHLAGQGSLETCEINAPVVDGILRLNGNNSNMTFHDYRLGICLLLAAGGEVDNIASVTNAECSNLGIDNLEGIEQASGLVTIDLSDNNISDAHQLHYLNDLTDADLTNNPLVEICDEKDNDYDDLIDEDGCVDGATRPCYSACGEGVEILTGGVWGSCSARQPSAEICDAKDNDCNGIVDDVTNAPAADVQHGICAGSVKVCGGINNWTEPDYSLISGYQPVETWCDGLDNDCDGVVDPDCSCVDGDTLPCSNECGSGVINCVGGVWENSCSVPGTSPYYGDPCTNGIGECARSGFIGCDGVCAAVAGNPKVEVCNGLDDNCDGVVDDNCVDDNEKPVVALYLDEVTELTEKTDIVIAVYDAEITEWKLQIRSQSRWNWTTIAEGTENVYTETVHVLDPTAMTNGFYELRVIAYDDNGLNEETDYKMVTVEGDLKIGQYSFALNDMTLPMTGVPITVTRAYNSHNKMKGDFGIGWDMVLGTGVKIQTTRVPGDNWEIESIAQCVNMGGNYWIPCNKLRKTGPETKVFVTFADGRQEKFVFKAEFKDEFGYTTNAFYHLEPVDGTTSELVAFGPAELSFHGAGLYDLLGSDPGSVFNPDKFQLTTAEGIKYVISKKDGLKQIIDTNGNMIGFQRNGMFGYRLDVNGDPQYAGKGVFYTRDAQGRIVEVLDQGVEEDPEDNISTYYSYDDNGDLVTFTDQEGKVWTYGYDDNHNLVSIIDPRGVEIIQTGYDDQGRLIATADGYGNVTTIEHDTENVREIITGPLGHQKIYEYNEKGYVEKEFFKEDGEAEILVKTWTYDYRGNELTQTVYDDDGVGHTTTWEYDSQDNKTYELQPGAQFPRTWLYDIYNNLLEEQSATGMITRYCYDDRRNLTKTIYPDENGDTAECEDETGVFNSTTYDMWGNITGITDPEGNSATLINNYYGYQTQITYPDGHIANAEYDIRGNQTVKYEEVTVGSIVVTVETNKEYDSKDRVTKTIYHDGTYTETEYNDLGKTARQRNVLGQWTEYSYNDNGALETTTYHDGTTEQYTYNVKGDKDTFTNREGRITKYNYDARDRLVSTVLFYGTPQAVESSNTYNLMSRLVSRTEAGVTVTYEYDEQGRKIVETDMLGNETKYQYDIEGNTEYVFTAAGPVIRNEYDSQNRKVKTWYHNPDSCTHPVTVTCENGILQETIKYNNNNRITERLDALNRKTAYTYDGNSRLVKTSQFLDGREISALYDYDEKGKKVSETDYDGFVTTWEYDAMGRVIGKTIPGDFSSVNSYNAEGMIENSTDYNNDTTAYTYDSVYRRLTKTDYLAGGEVNYTYEPVSGRISTVTDANGVTSYYYDSVTGKLSSKDTPDGKTLSYTYYPNGQIQTRDIGTETWTHTYDTLNRLETVTRTNGDTASYSWNAQGNLESTTDFAGNVTSYTYDWMGRLTEIKTVNTLNVTETHFIYELDDAGNRTAVTDLSGTRTEYVYDDLNRLVTETVVTPQNDISTTDYTYSDGGKILTKQTESQITEHTYDTFGRLSMIQVKDLSDTILSETQYQYDSNGNTISILKDGVETIQTFDFENRLETVAKTGLSANYTYDSNGNRIRSNVNGSITNYLVDESFVYPQVVSEYDDLGVVTTEYHRGLGLISMEKGVNEHFYRYDGLGSVRALSDGNNVTDTYDYDAYGELKTHTGTTDNSYLYTGEQYDEETGNYYLRARYYNPSAGQFISRDSWEGDDRNPITLNKYSYANSNPAMFTDPSGHWSMMEVNAIQSAVNEMSKKAMSMYSTVPTPEQTAKIDGTKLFKKRYYAIEAHAAWDPTNFINPRSINREKEYGGWVIRLKTGFLLYATYPTEGKTGEWDAEGSLSKYSENLNKSGNFPVAMYHTHGYEKLKNRRQRCKEEFCGSSNEADQINCMRCDSYPDNNDIYENFSKNDFYVAMRFGVDIYLGTAKGHFKYWDVSENSSANIITQKFTADFYSAVHPHFPYIRINGD